jgi:tripartite ATP-independent transporter DctP family solute receptor
MKEPKGNKQEVSMVSLRKLTLMLVAVLLVMSVATLAGASNVEFKLKFAHESPTSNARHKAAVYFAEQVEKNTDGRVQVTVYHSGQLGGERQLIEALTIGGVDFTVAGAGMFAAYAPALELIEMPYVFPDYETAHRVIDGPIGQKLTAPLIERGIRVLAFWENGFRHITNNVRPINGPADLKGIKIRTNKSKMRMETFSAFGASPVPIDFPELYMALSQGVVDGQENPLSNIYPSKFYEVQKYLSMTGHVYGALPMAVSERAWNKLPADLQEGIRKAAIEAGAYHRALIQEEDNSLLEALKEEGMIVNVPPSLKPFQEIALQIWATKEAEFGKELVEELLRAAGAIE